MTITFPTTMLVTGAYIALGADLTADPGTWAWTDISDYVRYKPGVRLRMHRTGEGAAATTCTAQLTLANDGRFSRRNPSSPHYGQLTMNTPIYLTVDVGEGELTRYEGYVNEWPRSWDISGRDSTAVISCSGVMRRPAMNSSVTLKSAPRRWIPTTSPLAFWSLEDGQLVDQGAAEVGSGVTSTFVGFTGVHPSGATISPPRWSGGQLAPWFPPTLALSGSDDLSIVWARVDMPVSTTTWTIDYYYGGGDLTVDIAPGYLTGDVGWPQLRIAAVDRLVSVSMNGEPETSTTVTAVGDGRMHHVRWTVAPSTTKVTWTVYIDGVSRNTGTTSGDMAVTIIHKLGLAAVNAGGSATVGHVAIWTGTPPSLSTAVLVANAYAGEQTHARLDRICDEISIPFTTSATASAVLGPEAYASPLSRMRDAEAVDGGVLYEAGFGLAYHSMQELENAAAALALDFDAGHIGGVPKPTDDDQRIRNRWTISRRNGATATVEFDTGPMGTAETGPGYEGSGDLNLYADTQIRDQAGWRCNLGTVDEDRWPSIPLRLHHTPSLINDFCDLHPGSRMTAANPPDEVAPDDINAFTEGWTERWDQASWEATLNTSPYRPYRVGTLATTTGDTSDELLRVVPDTLYLVDAVNSSATSWLVFADPRWTTTADNFPCPVRFGGEVATLTAVANVANDTFTRTVSAGSWGSATSGQAYTLVGTAADYNVNGTRGRVVPATLTSDYKAVIDVGSPDVNLTADLSNSTTPASGTVRMGVIGRYSNTSNFYHCEAQVATDGRVTLRIIKRVAAVITVVATVTTGVLNLGGSFLTIRFVVTGNRLRARVWPLGGTEPLLWYINTTDDSLTAGDSAGLFFRNDTASTAHVFLVDNLVVFEPKTWTVTRSVNGVTKSHSALTSGEINDPGVLGL